MEVVDVLSCHFGPEYETTKVSLGGGSVLVSTINQTSNLAEYKAIKGNLGAFKEFGLSHP
jgi:hypothetical protein